MQLASLTHRRKLHVECDLSNELLLLLLYFVQVLRVWICEVYPVVGLVSDLLVTGARSLEVLEFLTEVFVYCTLILLHHSFHPNHFLWIEMLVCQWAHFNCLILNLLWFDWTEGFLLRLCKFPFSLLRRSDSPDFFRSLLLSLSCMLLSDLSPSFNQVEIPLWA